jgi:SAM-dependent methyltransferase
MSAPAAFLESYSTLFTADAIPGTVLDLACGDGQNGLYLARRGLAVEFWDRSKDLVARIVKKAKGEGLSVGGRTVNLELPDLNPLDENAYGAVLVFRYLHRPLFPCIKKSVKRGGLLMYETFTIDQAALGRPKNPDFLLRPGELRSWFQDWTIIHCFEGFEKKPPRAIAQILCKKP